MNVEYSRYLFATGEIVQWGKTDEDILSAYTDTDHGVILGAYDGNLYYVSSGAATSRPANPATLVASTITADGASNSILSGLPVGAVVTLLGQGGTITGAGSTRSLSATDAGTFILLVSAFPYVDAQFEVTAVESLATRRANRIAAVDAALASRIDQGYAHSDGNTYPMDIASLLRATQYANRYTSSLFWPVGFAWDDITYTPRAMDYSTFKTFLNNVTDKHHAVRDFAAALKSSIMGSSNPETVDISTGWP